MTHIEAMNLALETLERASDSGYSIECNEAITAIKEALKSVPDGAQPPVAKPHEQGPIQKRPQNCGTSYCSCIECVMKPSPKAWLVEFENGEEELHFEEQSVGEIHTPLYTSPPPAAVQQERKPLNGVLVPLNVLEAAEESLGSFCSDHGWTDEDMQNMDNLSAYIAEHKAAHGITAATQLKE